ncbi:hypothetical protein NGRA_1693 [Nosema granulosis]|uniref:Uncharacterized protein n=1 Tax=Nosema granulosis TaxID=83296 RepID=A0A9P6KYX1_9MICR|nr:hypothetical protein NGRA_1693 [Nosema granulosis]
MINNQNLSCLLKDKKFSTVCSYLDTDVRNLDCVIESIEFKSISKLLERMWKTNINLSESLNADFIICCIYSILSNPFDFNSILKEKDTSILLNFCLANINRHEIGKLAISSLVLLNKKTILLRKNDRQYFIKDTPVSQEVAYSFLVQYSKGRVININFKEIDSASDFDFNHTTNNVHTSKDPKDYYFLNLKDSPLVLISKIEILSSQIKHYSIKKKVLEDFTMLLNHQNVSVGWSLANSMASIAKYFETTKFIEELKARCQEIFANESLWINTISILGILTLKGVDVGNVENIVGKALLYDNEFVYRSSLLREHTLFLIWALLKRHLSVSELSSEPPQYSFFDLLVFTYVFDCNYNVRRAAASVISEYIGIFNLENGYLFLKLLDKNYHKRLENADLLLNELAVFYDIGRFKKEHLKSKLGHYSNIVKEAASFLVVKAYDPKEFYSCGESLEERIACFYVLLYSLKQDRETSEMCGILLCKIDDKIYKTRNSEAFIYLYLICLTQVIEKIIRNPILPICKTLWENTRTTLLRQEVILNNLFYLLTKNIFPRETSILCWTLGNEMFNKKLLINLRRNNESFILVNSQQKELPIAKYKQNIANINLDVRIHSYKALKYVENVENFIEEIKKGLDDYTVDRRGDISYKIRLESLYLALHLNIDVEKYIIRYLVDKSKYLRDYCLVLLSYFNVFQVFKPPVVLSKDPKHVHFCRLKENFNKELVEFLEIRNLKPQFSKETLRFLEAFEMEMKKKINSPKMEHAYFESMIAAAETLPEYLKTEFNLGISSTIATSDKGLSDHLSGILKV